MSDESFNDGEDLLLLVARQSSDGFELAFELGLGAALGSLRQAQDYASSIGIGLGKGGRTPLDIHDFSSLKAMQQSFLRGPNPAMGVPKLVEIK